MKTLEKSDKTLKRYVCFADLAIWRKSSEGFCVVDDRTLNSILLPIGQFGTGWLH